MPRLLRLFAALVAAVALVASPAAAAPSTTYNATDAAFAAMMLPHHQGGVDLGELAATKGTNADVRRLGQNIIKTQSRQAKTLERMVRRFQTKASTRPEVMRRNELDMAKLKRLTGADFDRAWLDVISAHHMAAIMMADMEARGGRDSSARSLARRIVKEQRSELAQFNRLTVQLGG